MRQKQAGAVIGEHGRVGGLEPFPGQWEGLRQLTRQAGDPVDVPGAGAPDSHLVIPPRIAHRLMIFRCRFDVRICGRKVLAGEGFNCRPEPPCLGSYG